MKSVASYTRRALGESSIHLLLVPRRVLGEGSDQRTGIPASEHFGRPQPQARLGNPGQRRRLSPFLALSSS